MEKARLAKLAKLKEAKQMRAGTVEISDDESDYSDDDVMSMRVMRLSKVHLKCAVDYF
jgi:hypothetical protein